jgi:hypothetical protein
LPSEEASWCKFQNITDVQEAVSECFHMQIWECCVRGIKLLITLWQIHEPVGWLCRKAGHCSLFLWEMLFWAKSCWINMYSLCIYTSHLTDIDFISYKECGLFI